MVLWSNMKKCLLSLIVFLGICSPVPAMAETPESIELDTSFRENILALVEQSEEKKDSRGFLPDFRIDDNTLKEEVDDTHYPEFLPDYRIDDPDYKEEAYLEFEEEKSETLPQKVENAFKEYPNIKLSVSKKHPILPFDPTLFGERLYHEFETGPIEDVLVYGAYRGDFKFNFMEAEHYHTSDTTFMGEAGIVGKVRDLPIDYRFSLNFVPVKGVNYWNAMILDNFITIKAGKNNKIRIGHTRTANGYEGGMSGYLQPFINKAQISRTFSNARAIGAKVIGSYSLVNYDIGVFSSDRFFHDFFPGAEFVGNINFKPLAKTNGKYGKLIVGTSFNVGSRDNHYKNIGFNATYKYKKFKWDFEYMLADGYNGRSLHSSNLKADGFYTTLYYRLSNKIELLARYDQFTPNKDISYKPLKEYTAGINYRLKGDALKLMINYVYYDNHAHQTGSKLLVGTQFIF